ncbi:protein FAM47A [Fukomys damarensis]|uniref:Protein FAM47E n=1 Tax=Fukomys damarensis TaxID=885580 RepID=A0A091D817_FUKDA|nr:protein FAM47A [Fukomys damarensis]KFO28234.1 Protein FAM47E [Fukomys damarensis]
MVKQRWHLSPRVYEPAALGVTCQPSCKDHLPSKCFTKHKNKLLQSPASLEGQRWVFVREDLDDFRKGCPSSEGLITRGTKENFLPMVIHRVSQPGTKNSWRKPPNVSLYSTLSSAQVARKTFMHDVETCLAQNSSALYSTLEEVVPADLLLKALNVLDPDRKLEDTWDYCEGHRERTKKPTEFSKQSSPKGFPKFPKISQPRRYSLLQGDKLSKLYLLSSLQRNYMPQGIRDFCRWIINLGDFGIREDFLLKLFDIGFEFKPTYDENQMKKINLFPSELKYCKGLKKLQEMIFSIQEFDFERKLKKLKNPRQPKHEKIRYGAWYLKPKLWKKLINDEPLIDPKILSEAQREPPPDIIEELYGTIAFKDFIVSKGYSMPGILEKLFTRKGWSYDKFVIPIPKAVRAYERELAAFAKEGD